MPKQLENELKRRAKAKGMSKERMGAYVYGTMNKIEGKEHGSMSDELKRRAKSA